VSPKHEVELVAQKTGDWNSKKAVVGELQTRQKVCYPGKDGDQGGKGKGSEKEE